MRLQALIVTGMLWISLSAPLCRASPIFTLTNSGLPGIASSSVGVADFNNDGKLDILLTGTDGSFNLRSQLCRNLGGNVFSNVSAGLPGLPNVTSGSVVCGDYDNDGKLDFLLTGFAGQDTNHVPILISQIWRNLGNGVFTNIHAGLPGVDTGSVAWGDFDNDGHLDVLLTGNSITGAIAQIWRNQGNGAFTNINAGLTGVLYSSVVLGDFDNDGKLDILLAGTTNGFVSGAVTQVWRNLGHGVFTNINAGLPGVSQGAVAWGDFDNDGRLDILLTGYSVTGPIAQVWRNLGNGTFTNINAGLPGVYESAAAVGDFDNDGHMDILLSGVDASTNPICQVWRNLGNGAFSNLNAGLPGVRSGTLSWVDTDNDGKLDILLTGYDATNNPICRLYHNNIPPPVHSAFFAGEAVLGNGVYYLVFPNGSLFGYYSCQFFPFLYHFDLGFEYFIDANDGQGGAYLYDFTSGHFFYTSPVYPFPYLYDFSLHAVLYYFPDSQNPGRYLSNPRSFFNFGTGKVITQ